jgi:hypothetical protein
MCKKYDFEIGTLRGNAHMTHAPRKISYRQYVHSYRDTRLEDVYGRYSAAKAKAFRYCEELCKELNGYDLCITAHNTMAFTVGFEFPHPETGEVCVAKITRDYNYFAPLDECA